MLVATLSPGAFYYAHATPVGSAQTESQLIYFSYWETLYRSIIVPQQIALGYDTS